MAAQSQPLSAQSFSTVVTIEEEDAICSSEASVLPTEIESSHLGHPKGYLTGEARIERAWSHWKKWGSPKLVVAPMVDNSELPFRLLCRKYGAQAAYTPMIHSRIFSENQKYRAEEFTTCKEDRPLFVQFCANDPDILLEAARCPQRIARRGFYGAFPMDNLPLVRSLVEKLSKNLKVPVSCKVRIQICKIPLTMAKCWRMLAVLFWLYMEEQEMKRMERNSGLTGMPSEGLEMWFEFQSLPMEVYGTWMMPGSV